MSKERKQKKKKEKEKCSTLRPRFFGSGASVGPWGLSSFCEGDETSIGAGSVSLFTEPSRVTCASGYTPMRKASNGRKVRREEKEERSSAGNKPLMAPE
jgi:hypothetical protein